jgi:hypothetical protein
MEAARSGGIATSPHRSRAITGMNDKTSLNVGVASGLQAPLFIAGSLERIPHPLSHCSQVSPNGPRCPIGASCSG